MPDLIRWHTKPEAGLVLDDYVRATIAMRRFLDRFDAFLHRRTIGHRWIFKPTNPRWTAEALVIDWTELDETAEAQRELQPGEIAPGSCHTEGHTTYTWLVLRLLTEINWALDNQLVISPATLIPIQ